MKLAKLIGIFMIAAALLALCACSSGSSAQTTAPAQTTAAAQNGDSSFDLSDAEVTEIISYNALVDEKSGEILYYVSSLGELQIEDGKISQDDGAGASLVSTVASKAYANGAELLEENIDRSKNILAEFGEEQFAFYESSDNGVNVCYFGILTQDGNAVNVEMTFPTDARDTYFQHISMLVQIYIDVYTADAAA